MAMEINISGVPADGLVAVFGMAADKETVNGDQLFRYDESSISGDVHLFQIIPSSPRILIRSRSKSLRWRRDKERFSESLHTYIPEILLEYKDEIIQVDLTEYLENDTVMDEISIKSPLITIIEHESYEIFSTAKRIQQPVALNSDYSIPSLKKNMLFGLDSSKAIELNHFRHKLPREIEWLLYEPLPVNNSTRMECVFFGYEFGPDHGIDQIILEREPWRLDPSWNKQLNDSRIELDSILLSWGEISKYFTTREMLMYAPRFLHQENSLQLINAFDGGDPCIWHYFSLPKFLKFIQSKEMWFARPSTFPDPFESKTNKTTRAHQVQVVMRQIVDEYNVATFENESEFVALSYSWASKLKQNENGTICETKFATFDQVPIGLRSLAENRLDSINNSLLLNCWHANDSESDAMWGLYSDWVYGIAIMSTPNRIRQAFSENNVTLYVTPIEYHDLHTSDKVFDSLPVAYKHKAFEHEKEYRIYLSGYPLPIENNGVSLSVKAETLIEKIVLSPGCPPWFRDTIDWAVKSAKLNILIEDSIFNKSLY